jgi:hypothetical protein
MNVDEAIAELKDIKAREKGNGSKPLVFATGIGVSGFWVRNDRIEVG